MKTWNVKENVLWHVLHNCYFLLLECSKTKSDIVVNFNKITLCMLSLEVMVIQTQHSILNETKCAHLQAKYHKISAMNFHYLLLFCYFLLIFGHGYIRVVSMMHIQTYIQDYIQKPDQVLQILVNLKLFSDITTMCIFWFVRSENIIHKQRKH